MFPRQTGSWSHDPEYQANRAIIRAQRQPCARCGDGIDYDGPYWLIRNGRKTINRLAFHCGHIVDRADRPDHSLANLRAEHAGCSVKSGARSGAARRWGTSKRPATAALY